LLQWLFDAVLEQPGETGAQLVAERSARQPGVGVRAPHGQCRTSGGHEPRNPHYAAVKAMMTKEKVLLVLLLYNSR